MIGANPLSQGHVLVEDLLLANLDSYRQRNLIDNEAGGLLLGFRRGLHLHIAEFTPPFPTDHRTRTSFKRQCAGHAEIAHARWQASGGHLDYVGEWHSHPEAQAEPSPIDVREWRVLLRGRTAAMVFLVLGLEQDWLGVGVGLGSQIELIKTPGSG